MNVLTYTILDTPFDHSTPHYDSDSGHLRIGPSTLQGYCFKTFDPIRSLTLNSFSFTFDSDPPQRSFRNLIPTVNNLYLSYPTAHPASLFRFLSAFTNLKEVTIHAPRWIEACDHGDDNEDLVLSCSVLRLSELDDGSNPFISLLGSKSGGYEKLAVIKCNFRDTEPLQTLISHTGKTIRRLQLVASPHGEFDSLLSVGPKVLTRYASSGLGDVPSLSLTTCERLEQIFVTVVGANTSFLSIASTLSSVASLRFEKFILELRTATARRDPDFVQVELADRLSQLDLPLSQIAQVALEKDRKVSLVILGQDPEFLSLGFTGFQSIGCVWAGEEVDTGNYFWTLAAPKNTKRCCIGTLLNKLLRRKNLD